MRARGVAGMTSRIGSVRSTPHYATSSKIMGIMRRARGAVLRLVRRRRLAMMLGLALVAPAAVVEFGTFNQPWWAEGLALIVGATGLALFWTGLTGGSPDWVE